MEIQQKQHINKYLDLLLRRKKFIITILLIAVVAGLQIYQRTPKVYQATSLLMYQRQKINTAKISPNEDRRIGEMVGTVSQQVTSRANLEKLITKYNIYERMRKLMPLEDVIILMREKYISIKSLRKKGAIFSVSFQGSNPKKVMLVTNALASKFVEENIRFREERATETSDYIKDELMIAKKAIDKKEAIMRDYKLKYYNEMSGQRVANMARLNALHNQYNTSQNNIQNLEQTRLLVLEQISLKKELSARITRESLDETGGRAAKNKNYPNKINDLPGAQKALESLLLIYTDQHPDVIRLQNRIKKMEERQSELLSSSKKTSGDELLQDTTQYSDPHLEKLSIQLKDIELSLNRLNQERISISKQIAKYQNWVDAAPIREAEWASLTRDYNQFKKRYEYLVSRSLVAESAETLERRQKGSQVKIVDPAFTPAKPIKPDFFRIMAMSIFLGLGLSVGVTLMIDFFDSSFRNASDIESYIGIPVVCSIPAISTGKEKRKTRIKNFIWGSIFTLSSLAVLIMLLFSWKNGLIII